MRSKRALVDGDELIYKACKASEEDVYVGDHHVRHSDFGKCKAVFHAQLDKVKEVTGIQEYDMALSDQTGANFRKEYNPAYKSHRAPDAKPLAFHRLVAWVRGKYRCLEYSTLEADDVMGIMHEDYDMLVATDKDLKTIPTTVYDPYHDQQYTHDDEQADWYFLLQTLMGDRTDGYTGCAGQGKVSAAKTLTAAVGETGRIPAELFGKAWDAVTEAYEAQDDPDGPLLNARMARILRPGEWSPEAGATLWSPVSAYIDG